MTKMKKYAERIDDEVEDAKHYAEKYIECKAMGRTDRANHYHSMAEDELKHASWLHEMAAADVAELEKVYRPIEEMQRKWEETHECYAEKAAWVRKMLEM